MGVMGARWQLPLAAALLLALLLCGPAVVRGDALEGFEDASEQPGVRKASTEHVNLDGFADQVLSGAGTGDSPKQAEAPAKQKKERARYTGPRVSRYADRRTLRDWQVELAAGAFLLAYLVILFTGIQKNQRLAEAWSSSYTQPGGVFEKNFAQLGAGADGMLLREGSNLYKFYASGRRHCQGLLATLEFKPRQDAISTLMGILSPSEDTVTLEVYMSEASMPQVVLAVAVPKVARAMQRDLRDVERLTRKISVAKDQAPNWNNDKLWVMAEHSTIFYDLMGDVKVQSLFSHSTNPSMKYFRSLHITSDNSEGSHKRLLRFVFALPSNPNRMEEVSKLMEMVPLFIDVVGAYRLSPELKKKAIEARAREDERDAQDEEKKRQRLEALQQKKMEKLLEEKARIARMAPEARQKYEEKMQRQAAKKQMKTRMVRM